jgi:hypothetical protein
MAADTPAAAAVVVGGAPTSVTLDDQLSWGVVRQGKTFAETKLSLVNVTWHDCWVLRRPDDTGTSFAYAYILYNVNDTAQRHLTDAQKKTLNANTPDMPLANFEIDGRSVPRHPPFVLAPPQAPSAPSLSIVTQPFFVPSQVIQTWAVKLPKLVDVRKGTASFGIPVTKQERNSALFVARAVTNPFREVVCARVRDKLKVLETSVSALKRKLSDLEACG